LLGLVAIAAVTAGCSASSSGGASGPPVTPGPSRAGLVAAAHLAPCPASASTTTAGGLPDVTLPCLGDGPPVHVAGLRGMPTVVNIWGSWCEPCQHEMTYFASTYDADRSRVRFLGVDTVDSDDSALDFAAHVSPPMRFPSVVDEDKKVLLGIAADAPPVTLFVNSAGRVVGRHPGGYTSASQLHADIASYLHVS
jgi:thiol-disulfide isomerase/thioredoxin